MSDEIKDGGPAFPTENAMQTGASSYRYEGMSLRDYFAAKAMQGIVSSIDSEGGYQRLRGHAANAGLSVSQWIARDAYKQADAMLNEREAA